MSRRITKPKRRRIILRTLVKCGVFAWVFLVVWFIVQNQALIDVSMTSSKNLSDPQQQHHHDELPLHNIEQRVVESSDGSKNKLILPTKQRPDGGAFIHMGKTAGSTLSLLLRNGCHSYIPHPCRNVTNESMASKLILSYYHVPDFGFLQQSHHDFYLITTRDPFERTISAFTFEHLKNREARGETIDDSIRHLKLEMAYRCFPTLETFAKYLEGNPMEFNYPHHQSMVVPDSCQDLARAALFGKVKIYSHFFFSFERIKSSIPNCENQVIFATRQDNLWDDWKTINQNFLHQTTPVYIPNDEDQAARRNVTAMEMKSNMKFPVSRDLSPEGTKHLCNALITEYKAYFWFLKKAKNISKQNLMDAMNRAKTNCPSLKIGVKTS